MGSQPQQEVSVDVKGQWRDGKKMVDLSSNPDHSVSPETFLPSLSLGLFIHKMGTAVTSVHRWVGKVISQDSISSGRFN